MALSNNLFISFFCCCFLLTSGLGIHASSPLHHHDRRRHHHHREKQEVNDHAFRPGKLFVFGDSYADTGNIRKSLGNSWSPPYGTTLPGKPAGRFSDGRVLTDYLARFLGLKSPLAYELMKLGGKKLQNGLNFAYGGSGVFDTLGNIVPNMSTQIGYFEKLMDQSLYTKWDLQSSVVLVCLAGNDYGVYLLRPDATPQGLQNYIPLVVNQLALDLKRIEGLGATRIVVTALQPLGCLPRTTQTTSFRQCNATENSFVNYHNLLLQQAVAKLNNQTKSSSTFFILDLYSSFTTVLQQKGDYQGNLKFETPLKPCCMGINSGYSCGSVDERGEKMYTVCSDPKSSFFWDTAHPSDAGWHAVYTTLKSSLEQFIKLY
ncbi:GDSL esterase/lipase at5g03610 [Phtheirospermum japonicum]|uniref:GDSL esterase/lipase at5g03610 n=1 Tax=Phtheirospermum japonicum TaxID=374723 RepID=A0A830CCZ4_9LAMI|nr:GDSL esterase/lipase at5g03610 [Phtheirospermum japonicum]